MKHGAPVCLTQAGEAKWPNLKGLCGKVTSPPNGCRLYTYVSFYPQVRSKWPMRLCEIQLQDQNGAKS